MEEMTIRQWVIVTAAMLLALTSLASTRIGTVPTYGQSAPAIERNRVDAGNDFDFRCGAGRVLFCK